MHIDMRHACVCRLKAAFGGKPCKGHVACMCARKSQAARGGKPSNERHIDMRHAYVFAGHKRHMVTSHARAMQIRALLAWGRGWKEASNSLRQSECVPKAWTRRAAVTRSPHKGSKYPIHSCKQTGLPHILNLHAHQSQHPGCASLRSGL
eukprot:1152079-Pelagomonas_calceolata.AAC.15